MQTRLCLSMLGLVWSFAMPSAGHAQGVRKATPTPGPTAPGASEPRPTLRNRFGEVLRQPRILAFDGETFQVEHADGVAALPWDAMPEAWRNGYQRDTTRATAARRAQEQRRQDSEAGRDAAEAAAQEGASTPEPTPVKPVIIERKIRLGDLYLLPTIGGPEGELRIWRVSQTEVTFERRRYASQTVEKKLGFNSPRTFLFDDGAGCRVYYVDKPRTIDDRYMVTVQFEYAPGREPPTEQ